MFDRVAAAPDTAEDEGFESADEGQSDQQHSNFIRPDSRSNSFSDVSLASEGRSSSPVRPLSRLSRQSLAEHHAATNGHIPAAAQAIPSWSRNMEQYQQQNAAGSLYLKCCVSRTWTLARSTIWTRQALQQLSCIAFAVWLHSCRGVPAPGPLIHSAVQYCHMLQSSIAS